MRSHHLDVKTVGLGVVHRHQEHAPGLGLLRQLKQDNRSGLVQYFQYVKIVIISESVVTSGLDTHKFVDDDLLVLGVSGLKRCD